MPIYEYRCRSCGHELEKLRRMNDLDLTDCPVCDQSELTRLVSAAAFRLKGSGWYETDFKKGGKKNLHDSGDGASKQDTSTSGSSDSKDATKSSDTKSSNKDSGQAVKKKADAS